jgi:hypothetical protein
LSKSAIINGANTLQLDITMIAAALLDFFSEEEESNGRLPKQCVELLIKKK